MALLGEDHARAPDTPPEPQRSLSTLDSLIERTRQSVNDTKLEVIGTPGRLEPSVDAAAYCVAREALTNAVKHAGPDARIGITVSWMPELVGIEVTSGPAPGNQMQASDLSGGYGLLSLRERVGLAGGEIRWFSNGNEFNVDARFPLHSPSREATLP